MTDAEVDALAKEVIATIIDELRGWDKSPLHEVRETSDGELVPVYGAMSEEGYGAFLCEFMPLGAVKRIITECEGIFDRFTVEIVDTKTGESRQKRIHDGHEPESRSHSIRMMAECATLHMIGTFKSRLKDLLVEGMEDSKLIAESTLSAVVGNALLGVPGKSIGDVRLEIDNAAKRVAEKKRTHLVNHVKQLPHILAEREGRGGSDPRVPVSDSQCITFATDYPSLLQYWRGIASLRRQGLDWRAYAKVIQDTFDDLLDKLDDQLPDEADSAGADYPNIPSVLAHEHAARRCGIPPNTYKLSTHKNLRSRGDKLRSQVKDSE